MPAPTHSVWRRVLSPAVKAVCLVLLLQSARGVQIRSTYLNTVETTNPHTGNRTLWNQRTVTMEFHQNDNFDSSLKIGDYYYVFAAERPRIAYTAHLRGFIPEEIKLYRSKVVLTDAKSRTGIVPTNITNSPSGDVSPAGRRLLGLPAILIAGAIGVAIGGGAFSLGSLFGGGGGGNYDEAIKQLTLMMEAHSKQVGALQDWQISQEAWKDTVQGWMEQQDNINTDVQDILNNYADMFKALDGSVEDLTSALDELAKHSDEQDRKTEGYIKDVWLGIGDSTALLRQHFDENMNRMWDTLTPILSNMSTSIDSVGKSEQHNRRILAKRIRDALRNIRKTAEVIRMAQLRTAVVREMSPRVHWLMEYARSDGFEPFLHPDFMGSPPSQTISTTAQRVFVDRTTINRIVDDGGPQLSSTYVTLYCNYPALAASLVYEPVYEDFFELLGPNNCTQKAGDTVRNCRCWIEVEEERCTARADYAGQGLFFWEKLPRNLQPDAYKAHPSYCQGGATPVKVHSSPRKLDNVKQWHALLGQLSCGNLYPGGPNGDQIQLLSSRVGKMLVKQDKSSEVCNFDYDMLFETGAFGNTLPFALYNYWLQAFKILMSDAQGFEVERYGSMPNHLTCKEHPFETFENGVPYATWVCSFLGVSPRTLPVYELQPDTVSTTIRMRAFKSPPICPTESIDSCVSEEGEVTDEVGPRSFQVQSNTVGPLPLASDVIVGNLGPTSTHFYDLPRTMASLAIPPTSREGTATYLLQPVPEGMTQAQAALNPPPTQLLDEWLAQNGNLAIDAERGAFSMADVKKTLQGGVCVSDRCSDERGWLASLLDDYEIDRDATDLPAGRFVIRAKRYSGTGTAEIIDGEIIRRVEDGCPEIDFITYRNDYVQLSLKNSLPQALQLVYEVTSDKPFCTSTGEVNMILSPKQTYLQRLERCGEQLLTVSRVGANGQRTVCEGVFNITVSPGAASSVDPFVLGGYNETRVVDTVLVTAVDIVSDVTGLIQQILPFLNPVAPPTITGEEWKLKVSDTLNNFTNYINNKVAGVDLTGEKASEKVSKYLDGVTEKMAGYDAAFQQAQGSLQSLDQRIVEQQVTLEQSKQAAAAAEAALNASIAANAELQRQIAAAVNAINDLEGECCGIWLLCEFIVCPFIDFLKMLMPIALFAGVAWAAWWLYKKYKVINSGKRAAAYKHVSIDGSRRRYPVEVEL